MIGPTNGHQKMNKKKTNISNNILNPNIKHLAHTRATPKYSAAPVTKKSSPTYSPKIQGWDFRWLELLEWLEAGG